MPTANQPVLDAFSRCQDFQQKIDLLIAAVAELGSASLAKSLDATLDGWHGVVKRGDLPEQDPEERILLAEVRGSEEVVDGPNPPSSTQTEESALKNKMEQKLLDKEAREASTDDAAKAEVANEASRQSRARGEAS